MKRELLFRAARILFENLAYKLHENNIDKDKISHIHAMDTYKGQDGTRIAVDAMLMDDEYQAVCDKDNNPIESSVDIDIKLIYPIGPIYDSHINLAGEEFRQISHIMFYHDKIYSRQYF